MGLIKLALALWLADPSLGRDLPTPLALQTGATYLYGHRIPGFDGYLALGDYDRVTNTSYVWLFKRSRLWRQHLVEGDWQDSQYLQYFSLPGGGFALGRPGMSLSVLVFPGGAEQAPEYFHFRAPDGAQPWSVPSYQLSRHRGRLAVELYYSTPDGDSGGKPTFLWDGSGWLFYGSKR